MRYPSYGEMKKISKDEDLTYSTISICLDTIIQGENVYTRKDFQTEIDEFLGNLTKERYAKLINFADNLPSFYVQAHAKCDKCGNEHNIEYDESFGAIYLEK